MLITTSNIILEGESREGTIIDGNGVSSPIVDIWKVDDVSIDKFTVQNGGNSQPGICLHGDQSTSNYVNGCTITNINCEDNDFGITLVYAGEDSSNYNTIQYIYCNIEDEGGRYQSQDSIMLENEANYNQFSDCYIFQSQDTNNDGAVTLFNSDGNTFTNIEITGNDGDGFYLECDSNNNEISTCEIQYTENGIHLDGTVLDCNGNHIVACDIDSNENSCICIDTCDLNLIEFNNLGCNGDSASYVIELTSSSDNEIRNNILKAADVGIGLSSGSDSNTIQRNWISCCWSYAVEIGSSDYNQIDHNNFTYNNGAEVIYNPDHIQAFDEDDNYWDNGYPEDPNDLDIDIHGGNHWSDWTPEDFPDPYDIHYGQLQDQIGSDEIADLCYIIDEYGSFDFYPLKEPVEI